MDAHKPTPNYGKLDEAEARECYEEVLDFEAAQKLDGWLTE